MAMLREARPGGGALHASGSLARRLSWRQALYAQPGDRPASLPAVLPPHPSLVRGRELWNPGRQPPQPAVRFQTPLQGPCGNFKLRKSKVCISVIQPAASESCDGTSGRAHFGNSEEHRARRRAAQDHSGRGGLAGRGRPLGAGHAGPPSLRNTSKRRDRAARNPRHRAGVTATRPRPASPNSHARHRLASRGHRAVF